jgi:hypothetical protein
MPGGIVIRASGGIAAVVNLTQHHADFVVAVRNDEVVDHIVSTCVPGTLIDAPFGIVIE